MNPFYNATKNKLLAALKRKKEMETNFQPSMIEDYKTIETDISTSAADLLKLGAICSKDKPDIVTLLVDEELIDVPEKSLRSVLGDDFELIVNSHTSNYAEDNFDSEEKNNGDDDFEKDCTISEEVEPEVCDFNSMYGNPFAQMFMNMMMGRPNAPFQKQPKQTPAVKQPERSGGFSEILKEIANIQGEVLYMEQEKGTLKAEMEMLNRKYQILKNDIKGKEEQFSNARVDFEEKINEIQTQVDYKDAEIKDKTEKINELNSEIGKLRSALADSEKNGNQKYENISKELREKNEKLHSLQDSLTAATRDLENTKKELSKVRSDFEQTKKQLSESQNKTKELEKNASVSFDKEKQEYEKRISDMKSQIDTVNAKASKIEKEYFDYKKQIEEGSSSSVAQVKTLQEKNNALEKEISELREASKKDKEHYKEIEDSYEHLSKLAYSDDKTNARNSNAFNEEFAKEGINGLILSHVCTCGMKEINAKFGRAAGDKAIGMVVNALMEEFPDAKIYRVLGDQFIVLNRNLTKTSIGGKLADVTKKLADSQIFIAHGTAIGNNCKDKDQLLSFAEDEMFNMKNKIDINFSVNDLENNDENPSDSEQFDDDDDWNDDDF